MDTAARGHCERWGTAMQMLVSGGNEINRFDEREINLFLLWGEGIESFPRPLFIVVIILIIKSGGIR